MSRICLLLALAVATFVPIMLGPAEGQSVLLWWQKALLAVAGGALALIALRLLPSDGSPQPRSATGPDEPRRLDDVRREASSG